MLFTVRTVNEFEFEFEVIRFSNHSRHIIWYQSISCDLRQEPKTEERLTGIRLINLIMAGDKEDLPRGFKFGTGTGYGLTTISC